MSASEPVVLVDVMNLAFRSHYAHRLLTSGEGNHTGVLFGFLRTIADLQKSVSRKMVFAWDHGVPVVGAQKPRNWRDAFIVSYKGKRSLDDAERAVILSQLPAVESAVRTLGYSSVAIAGLEADDVIGILSREIEDDVAILSSDKDFYQLLDEARVCVLVPKKKNGKFQRIHQSDVERDFGIPVSRWAEYLALGGDKSDGIKPMRGMGPKTAIQLIHGGVDLEKKLEEQPAKFREKYGAAWDAVLKCYSAARVPVRRNDPRIRDAVKNGFPPFAAEQSTRDLARRRSAFDTMCADYDMHSVLAARHLFFERKGERQCAEEKTASPSRRQRSTLV